jgi:hypothetical protein
LDKPILAVTGLREASVRVARRSLGKLAKHAANAPRMQARSRSDFRQAKALALQSQQLVMCGRTQIQESAPEVIRPGVLARPWAARGQSRVGSLSLASQGAAKMALSVD